MEENELAKIAVDICFRIHTKYGAGLFESIYEKIFFHEWSKTGLDIKIQQGIPVIHDGVNMGIGFIPDVIIGEKLSSNSNL